MQLNGGGEALGKISVAGAFAILLLAGCSHESGGPPRPAHVPDEAVFVGGESGGDWMACEGTNEGVVHCRIFDPLSPAYFESWFRYCPQLGDREVGRPMVLDWERGLRLSAVQLRRDRPDKYHPAPGAPIEQVHEQQALIDKYYRLDGVSADCTPVANPGAGASSE